MVGLLDVAPVARTVDVNGHPLPVNGVSLGGLARILASYPEVRQAFMGKTDGITPDWLLANAPGAVAAIIAEATGLVTPETLAAAERLPVAVQAEILEAAVDLTFPRGIGPFVDQLTALASRAAGDGFKAPGLNLPKRPKRS